MKKYDLLVYLSNLSEEDIGNLSKFLNSPYYNSDKSLVKLFDEIIKNIKLFARDYQSFKDLIIKKLDYSEKTVTKQMSYLCQSTTKFLRLKSFENDVLNSELNFNDYLLNNKLIGLLKENLTTTELLIKDDPKLTDNKYLQSFKNNISNFTSLIYFSGYNGKNESLKSHRILDTAFTDIMLYNIQQITGLYINNYFLIVNNNENRDGIFDFGLNTIFSYCKKNKIFDGDKDKNKVFNIYLSMYNAFHFKNEKTFFLNYKKNIENNINLLSKELIKFHYKVLINFCLIKERLAEEYKFYEKEHLNLMFEYFDNDYYKLDDNDFINSVEFTNFISHAFSVGELDIIKSFVDRNSSKLKVEEYDNMIKYGYAYYYFGKKLYQKAIKCINDISNFTNILKYNMRNIELRIYYERGKYETLRNALHNYNTSVLDDKMLTTSDKFSLQKLLRYLNNLVLIQENKNIKEKLLDAEYNRSKIINEPVFSLKDWLTEKFDEILTEKGRKKQKRIN